MSVKRSHKRTGPPVSAEKFNYVTSGIGRLCQRPQRTPGVAPPCEDDKLMANGYATSDEYRKSKVTLPEVQWLKRRST